MSKEIMLQAELNRKLVELKNAKAKIYNTENKLIEKNFRFENYLKSEKDY